MTTKKQNTEFAIVASLAMIALSVWYPVDLTAFAGATLLAGLLLPKLFMPFAWLWFGLAKVLERVMSKVALSLIFFLVITPVGLLRRVLGKDNLHTCLSKKRKNIFETSTHTYQPEDFERQF